MQFILCAIYIVVGILGMTLIKMGASTTSFLTIPKLGISISRISILGIICYGVSFCLYTFIISKMKVSLTIPVLAAINSSIIFLIGILIFKEHVHKIQVIGIGFIIMGTFLVGNAR